ncbi:hypothetical protein ACLOJK_017197 [Asimina triloba]
MFRTETPRLPFPFGSAGHKLNPSPSKTPNLISKSFDENLLRRLDMLDPPSVAYSWLSRAVDLLSSTHAEAESLISDLTASAPEKSLPSFLDDSIKVLDVCNSITAEIERLRQGRLLIHLVLHLLRSGGPDREVPAPESLSKARDLLAEHGKSTPLGKKSLTLESSAALIRDLARATGAPQRGKIHAAEKALRHVIYAAGAVTVFLAGAIVAILAGLPDVVVLPVPSEFLWSEKFNAIQVVVSGEIRKRFSGDGKRHAEEREAVEAALRRAADVIAAEGETDAERLRNAVKDLETATKDCSDGLDRLADGMNGFFRAVLCTRNTVLKKFRVDQRKQNICKIRQM